MARSSRLDKKVVPPSGLRLDRSLAKAMSNTPAQAPLEFAVLEDKQRDPVIKTTLKSLLKKICKPPLARVRSFLIAPVTNQLEALHNMMIARDKVTAETARNVEAIQEVLSRVYEDINGLIEPTAALHSNSITLLQNVGYLHVKADESALKARPVFPVQDAFAVPVADGYLIIPKEEEALLLMFGGAGSSGLEPGTRHILQAAVQPGDFAIDVGASVGLHSIALARAVGASGRVEAFEAEPRLIPYFKRTLALNGFEQVGLHNLAVGAQDGNTTFNVAKTIGHSSLYGLHDSEALREQISVPIVRLDSVVPADRKVDLIKIDVEGAELDVLAGSERILENSPECLLIAECGPSHLARIGRSLEEWFSAFSKFGYIPFAISEPDGKLNRIDHHWMETRYSVNILFAREEGRRAEKLLRLVNG